MDGVAAAALLYSPLCPSPLSLSLIFSLLPSANFYAYFPRLISRFLLNRSEAIIITNEIERTDRFPLAISLLDKAALKKINVLQQL